MQGPDHERPGLSLTGLTCRLANLQLKKLVVLCEPRKMIEARAAIEIACTNAHLTGSVHAWYYLVDAY